MVPSESQILYDLIGPALFANPVKGIQGINIVNTTAQRMLTASAGPITKEQTNNGEGRRKAALPLLDVQNFPAKPQGSTKLTL